MDEKGRQVYSCPICGKKILQASLKNHLKFHDEKSLTFKCDACDKSYCTSSSLAYHKRVAHRPDATPGMSTIIPCGEPVDSGKDDVYVAACQQPANGLHVDPIAGVRRQSRVLQKYPCRHCSLVLVGRLRLARHLVAHHGDEAAPAYGHPLNHSCEGRRSSLRPPRCYPPCCTSKGGQAPVDQPTTAAEGSTSITSSPPPHCVCTGTPRFQPIQGMRLGGYVGKTCP